MQVNLITKWFWWQTSSTAESSSLKMLLQQHFHTYFVQFISMSTKYSWKLTKIWGLHWQTSLSTTVVKSILTTTGSELQLTSTAFVLGLSEVQYVGKHLCTEMWPKCMWIVVHKMHVVVSKNEFSIQVAYCTRTGYKNTWSNAPSR